MRRLYTREAYIELVNVIRNKIPKIALSSDFISGFCGETESEFNDTLELIKLIKYDMAFLFSYSMRDKTHAFHNFKDDVCQEVKADRLKTMINIFKENQLYLNEKEVNSYHLVFVEGRGKKPNQLFGKTDTYKNVVFFNNPVTTTIIPFLDQEKNEYFIINNKENLLHMDELYKDFYSNTNKEKIELGEYVIIKINEASHNTLYGTPVCKSGFKDFFRISKKEPYFSLKTDKSILFNDYTDTIKL